MWILTLNGSSWTPHGSGGSDGADTRDPGGAELPAALGSLIWGCLGMPPEHFCPKIRYKIYVFLPHLQTPTNFPANPVVQAGHLGSVTQGIDRRTGRDLAGTRRCQLCPQAHSKAGHGTQQHLCTSNSPQPEPPAPGDRHLVVERLLLFVLLSCSGRMWAFRNKCNQNIPTRNR